MHHLPNDPSIYRQFREIASFRCALARLMTMRVPFGRWDREVYSHRALLTVDGPPEMLLQQELRCLAESERGAAMGWLTRADPFWLAWCGISRWAFTYWYEIIRRTGLVSRMCAR